MNIKATLQQSLHSPKKQQWAAGIALCLIPFGLWKGFAFFSSPHHGTDKGPSVVTAIAKHADVPIYLSGLGSVLSRSVITVRTQINGQLLRLFFKEGQRVKTGDLLAQIDPSPYEAQLRQYQGQLVRDVAALENSKTDLKRYQRLWKQDSISKQTLDTQIALVKENEGTVKTDEGLIESAQVNLRFCRITSPVDGQIGLFLVNAGNFVTTTDTNGIAVINTQGATTVEFSIPEDDLPRVQKQLAAHKTLVTEAYNRDRTQCLGKGILVAVDNQIDPTTGTVKLRANFTNDNNALFPNQFVNIQLLLETIPGAVVVPTAAIQYGVAGTFVYAVTKHNIIQTHPVTIGVSLDDTTSIASGLDLGEIVVTEGADKLTEGQSVSTTMKT
jgi:multidrug efflux system membrane fusion protein